MQNPRNAPDLLDLPPNPRTTTTMSIGDFEPPNPKPIVVRSVWADNLDYEFDLISALIDRFAFVTMDTEFPGVIHRPNTGGYENRLPTANYLLLKANVDLLSLIQIGLTISDDDGNLPDIGTEFRYIWEFNFRDFDVTRDAHDSDSVELLKRQGIDFERNRTVGVDSLRFAELMLASGLVCNESVSWVTFHGAYDFGYLVKVLTRQELPRNISEFLDVLKVFFGDRVYDAKHMIRFCSSLHGGLDRVAKALGIERVVGKGHQAGSDSLLTMLAFQKIKEIYFCQEQLDKCAGVLHGLEAHVRPSSPYDGLECCFGNLLTGVRAGFLAVAKGFFSLWKKRKKEEKNEQVSTDTLLDEIFIPYP